MGRCTLALALGLLLLGVADPSMKSLPTVPDPGPSGTLPLFRFAEQLDDFDGAYTFDRVRRLPLAAQFRPAQQPGADFHYHWRWYRFRIVPTYAASAPSFLLVGRATDFADLYIPSGSGATVLRFGMQTPVVQRADRSGLPIVQIPRKAAGRVLYLRTLGIDNTGPAVLGRDAARSLLTRQDLEASFYAGVFGVFCVTALIFFFMTRDLTFLVYSTYMGAWMLETVIGMPFAWRTVWPWTSIGYTWPYTLLATVAFAASALFARLFLDTRRYVPRIDALLVFMIWVTVLGVPLSQFLMGRYGITDEPVGLGCTAIILVLGLTAAGVRLRQGFRPAAIYAVGLLLAGVAVLVYFADLYRVIPPTTLGHEADNLGLIIDALAFLVALAYRAVLAGREREAALAASDAANARAAAEQRERVIEVERHNVAVRRFVPHEFLDALGRRDVTEVRLGDHVEREMTILFSDIRGFTTLSETLSPQESFDFINQYLGRVGPVVRGHGGFVDKYIGDAIMALFANSAGAALDAAIALQHEVRELNFIRSRDQLPSFAIGVGMHRGLLMLGTIGESERYESTVIADSVNVASRFEGLTKVFGADIIISGSVASTLSDPASYCLRPLGQVLVKGTTRSAEAYEVFDSNESALFDHKRETLDAFTFALSAYRRGDFDASLTEFATIAMLQPRDLAAAFFRDRSAERHRGPSNSAVP